MERTLNECIEALNEMVREARRVLDNAETTPEGVLEVQEYRRKLNDFLNGSPGEANTSNLRAYEDVRRWTGPPMEVIQQMTNTTTHILGRVICNSQKLYYK